MWKILGFILAVTCSSVALAEPSSILPDQTAKIEKFVDDLKVGNAARAYEGLFAGTRMSDKPMDLQSMSAQTTNALSLYGKINGWSLIEQKDLSPDFSQVTFLLKTDATPLFFKFDFYRPNGKWLVTRVFFNDQYSKLPE
jgi:hypothetical protein